MSGKGRSKVTRRRLLQSGAGLAAGGALVPGDAARAEPPPAGRPGVYEALGVRPVINAAGTPLVGHLVARRVDTLLITGCSTSACVRATATDAKSCGLRPMVVREAVQDRSEVAHEWTLFDVQARFADVVGLGEALAYLRELPNGDLR